MNKYISRVIKVYAGVNEYRIKKSQHFATVIKDERLEEGETIVSYDVKALYPSVPQEEAIKLIEEKLKGDEELKTRTSMKPNSIIELLRLCVKKTYFTFNKKLYMQIDGLAIGAPTSAFAADIFMYQLEKRAM